ncbi:hypothetical protein ACWAUQ_000560 [Klebsiella pneumoniae]|uniref:hypothetical protein n=1 Tax=Klebsiella TaxID=570 RepID=UPI000DFC260F|nr:MULTISPECIES: hypothetical protein [Klebsiella]HCI6798076.1 hypothetical protein [Klebsiella quasipneumoniae subsp. quasipneumoniae]EJK8940415.1 hypothetical protein [Klebsiella pneumoniae]MCU8627552.1 hypothetical protein [Klebsiella pneumoniae]MCU8703617.1 hypothetical protein [Klebsiella pneumoniae]MCU8757024.1 hypothetical protein [Klebsiella pneumoniae]
MNESELKKFIFSETVKVIAALSTKPSGFNQAYGLFDIVYDDLMKKAKEKNLDAQ